MSEVQPSVESSPLPPLAADVGSDSEVSVDSQEKADAVAFLNKFAQAVRRRDPECRLYWGNHQGGEGLVAFLPEEAEERTFGQQDADTAKECLEFELGPLQDVGASDGDREVVGDVFRNIRSANATVGDILKLHEVVSSLPSSPSQDLSRAGATPSSSLESSWGDYTPAESPDRSRYQAYCSLKQAALKAGANRSGRGAADEESLHNRVDFSRRTVGKVIGKRLAAAWEPLGSLFKNAPQEERAHFQRSMNLLSRGRLPTKGLIDLFELVDRQRDPHGYARFTIKRLYKMAQEMGPGKSIAWNGASGDFAATSNRILPTGKCEAGWRFGWILSGLMGWLGRSSEGEKPTEELVKDNETLKRALVFGGLTTDHISYLHGLLERGEDPTSYALKELERLNAIAEEAGEDKSITWRDNGLKVLMHNRRWMTAAGRRDAGKRIAWRLEGLKALIPNTYDRKAYYDLLNKIESGEGKSTDIMRLHQLMQRRQNEMNGRKEADAATKQDAAPKSNSLSKSLARQFAKENRETLVELETRIQNANPGFAGRFSVLHENVRRHSVTRSEIKEIMDIAEDTNRRYRVWFHRVQGAVGQYQESRLRAYDNLDLPADNRASGGPNRWLHNAPDNTIDEDSDVDSR